MPTAGLFFPVLTRRAEYERNKIGDHYAYSHYRDAIREDCQLRCVYCDIHEVEVGGAESMHLDHFRPRIYFEALINDPTNLVWACAGCNRLKWNHWPARYSDEFFIGSEGFIEPFLMMRTDFFDVDEECNLEPLQVPAAYQIELLHLNRQSRRSIRMLRRVRAQFSRRLIEKAERIEELVENQPEMSAIHRTEFLNIASELKSDAETILQLLFSV